MRPVPRGDVGFSASGKADLPSLTHLSPGPPWAGILLCPPRARATSTSVARSPLHDGWGC